MTAKRTSLPGNIEPPAKVDGRSAISRRLKVVQSAIEHDLGGAAALSFLQATLVRRIAALVVACETAETALAAGEPIDVERLTSNVALLSRLARQLGIKRAAGVGEQVETLEGYLAQRATEDEAAGSEAEVAATGPAPW